MASLPDEFASQYFYLLSEGEEKIKQIYSFNKNFPALKIGDLIEITGEKSPQLEPERLKIKSAGDIRIIRSGNLPTPAEVPLGDLTPDLAGQRIKVSGNFTIKRGKIVYLDDGASEGSITLPKLAGAATIKKGDLLEAVGIAKLNKNEMTVVLRSLDDLKISSSTPQASSTLTEIPPQKQFANRYIFGTIGLLCLIVGSLIWYIVRLDKKQK